MIAQGNTIRELNHAELDNVGGGLTLGLGLDLSSELGFLSKTVGAAGGLVENLAGGLLKAVGGAAGGVLGAVGGIVKGK